MVLMLAVAAFSGYRKGLIVEVFSFLAFFLGLFLAMRLSFPVTRYFFEDSPLITLISMVVFFVLFLFLVWGIKLAASWIKTVVNLTLLGWVDNLLGAFASTVKWLFILSVVMWIFESFGIELPLEWTSDSMVYSILQPIGPALYGWLSEYFPIFHDLIKESPKAPVPSEAFL